MRVLAPALAALILTVFTAHPLPAQDLTGSGSSPDGTRVQPSTTERIDRHNVCREVTNKTLSPIMIPHRDPTEWAVGEAAFLGNPYPNVLVAPCAPVITTIYDAAGCSVNASGGDADFSTGCGPDYVTGLDMTFSFEDGTCEAPGLARVRRIIGQNLYASFFHAYLCQERETGRPGHFHLGEVEAADASVPDVTIGGEVYVAADPFTLSGLTAAAVLSWEVGGWAQGAAVRINGGSWVTSETAPAASRTVQNGDRVEVALRTGGADANALNWALLTVTPSGSPELSLTRDFAVLGNRTTSLMPTLYQYGTCLIDEGLGVASPNGCGEAYASVTGWNGFRFQMQQTNMSYNLVDGSCSDLGRYAIVAKSTENPPAAFFHSYRCDQRLPGMPDQFFFGYHDADDAALDAFEDSGTVYVVSPQITVSGLTGDGVLSWHSFSGSTTPVYTTDPNQDVPSMMVRINGGAWLLETGKRAGSDPHALSEAARTVRNGDRVEVAIRPGSGGSSHRWGTLSIAAASDPAATLTREFGLYGNRPPPPPPLTSGGGVSTTNETHPVFQLFQACFQVPPGSHLNFPNACTLDAEFWEDFEAAACAPSPHGLTITMGGFSLGNSGSACSEVGFDEFISRAKVSTCEPSSCGINENGPSACVFSCE